MKGLGRGIHVALAVASLLSVTLLPGALWAASPGAEPEPPGPPVPRSGFPTPEQLGELGPAPTVVLAPGVVPVDEWELTGPFPSQVGALPHREDTPWFALLESVAAKRAGLALTTEGMHCAARELGRFYLETRGRPDESLQRFIQTRCRSSAAGISFGFVDGPAPDGVTDETLFGHWKESIEEGIEAGLRGGPRTAGIWFGRAKGHAVAAMAYGERAVHVEPFSPVADEDGRLVIEGEVLVPARRVGALANRGRYGVASCRQDPELTAPRFRFTCELAPGDVAAAVSVSVTPPDALLSRAGVVLLAGRGGEPPTTYRRARYGKRREVDEEARVPELFVEQLNAVRKEAGLSPVALDAAQSRAATELAPHFFEAVFGRARLTADLVVLGMIAGWGIDGIVEAGHFSAAWIVDSTDVSRLLSTALEYPDGRDALLADDIDRVAVGPLLIGAEDDSALAAVFGTYALFSEQGHEELAKLVYEKLEKDRAAKSVGAPGRLDELGGLCRRAAGQVSAGGDPADAMNGLLTRSVDVLRAPVSGWVAEVSDMEMLEFPLEYLTSPTLRVGVAVSVVKREGSPRGHYVVMLVVSDPEAWGA